MNVGDKIKEFRLEKNMKQSDLADKAEISRVAVGNYERNERQPTIDIAVRIAKALDVSITELVDWDLKHNPDGKLEEEVDLIEKIEKRYGKGSAELVHFYSILDDQEKEKAFDYVYYLAEQHEKNKEKKTPGAANTKDQGSL